MKSMEQRLVERLKKDDTAALGKIIDGYAGYAAAVIRNFARGSLPEQDIDDICMEVFCSLWEHRANLDAERGLRAYLSAMARNAVKNRFRSAPPPTADIDEPKLSDSISVEYVAELGEVMRELDKALQALPPEDKEAFMRFYFYGQKSSEIAIIMNTAEGTVRSRLSRTREKLRRELKDRGFEL